MSRYLIPIVSDRNTVLHLSTHTHIQVSPLSSHPHPPINTTTAYGGARGPYSTGAEMTKPEHTHLL